MHANGAAGADDEVQWIIVETGEEWLIVCGRGGVRRAGSARGEGGKPLVPKGTWQWEARCVVDGGSGIRGRGGRGGDERGADDSATWMLRAVSRWVLAG